MQPLNSRDCVPVSLDPQECPVVINGPAWHRRQFRSIRNWNALDLIRLSKPKYPLLIMRTLCHSLTLWLFWPCSERAFAFLLASRNGFSWWDGGSKRAVIFQLCRNRNSAQQLWIKIGIWGHLIRARIHLPTEYFFFSPQCIEILSKHAFICKLHTFLGIQYKLCF